MIVHEPTIKKNTNLQQNNKSSLRAKLFFATNMPLVSIIIPVYKVESYLRRCLDSIVSQTYTNLEIILVDDGSPDNCPQICDEYAAKDKRIIVIHKENGGLSDARNAGLDICRGEFISFVDSDDWVDEKYIEILFNLAIKQNADIAICENIVTDREISRTTEKFFSKTYSSKEALFQLFRRNQISFIVSWGKIYKRTLFESVRFPIGKYHEDDFTTYILFYNSKKIVYSSYRLYFYYQRAGSIITSRHPWDVLEYMEQQYQFFKEKKETDLLPLLLKPLCWQLLCAYWFEYETVPIKANEFLSRFQRCTKEEFFKKMPLFHKFFLKLFARFPHLYLLYRRLPFHLRKEF